MVRSAKKKFSKWLAIAAFGYALAQSAPHYNLHAQARPPQARQQVSYAAFDEETIKIEKKMQDGTVVGFRTFKSGKRERYIIRGSEYIAEDENGNLFAPTKEIYDFATAQPNFIFTKSNMHAPEPEPRVDVNLVFPTPISKLEKDYPHASRYIPIVQKYAAIYGIDPMLEMAVLKVESDFGTNLISPVTGAGCPNQLLPTTAEDLGIQVFWPEGWSRERYIDAMKNGNSDELAEYANSLIEEHSIRGDGMGEVDGRFIDDACIGAGMKYLKEISDKLYSPVMPPQFPSLGLAAYFAGPNLKKITPAIEKYVKDVWDIFVNY